MRDTRDADGEGCLGLIILFAIALLIGLRGGCDIESAMTRYPVGSIVVHRLTGERAIVIDRKLGDYRIDAGFGHAVWVDEGAIEPEPRN